MKGALATVAAVGALAAPIGWWTTDHLESDNEFCVSCHLDADTPLHDAKMREGMAAPPVNLTSLHLAADPDFLCIACHGGASFANRLRVKSVAARDALAYVLGRFEEPGSMEHPLWDEDCVQCHETYAPERADDFHAIPDHNVPGFAHRCVGCHRAHPTGGDPRFDFLEPERVRNACRDCHEEL